MRANTAALALCFLICACTHGGSSLGEASRSHKIDTGRVIDYPDTRRETVSETHFGIKVEDPYRWLEDDRSEETLAWVTAQNVMTQNYLNQIPYRQQIAITLEKLFNYERERAPFFEGGYTYFYRNDGLQNQDVLYRQQGDGEAEIFLNPNNFSPNGTISMSQVSFSRDGTLVAYQLSDGGSDWRSIVVRDVETGKTIGDAIENVKFSSIAWRGNQGFYYSSYDKPQGSELSAKTDNHKLYFHTIGTSQAKDTLVFGGADGQRFRYVGASVTEDDRFLSVYGANSTSGNQLFIADLSARTPILIVVLGDEQADAEIVDAYGDALFIKTNRDAPNGRLVRVAAATPGPEHWQDVIPETDSVLSVATGANYFFALYTVDALSQVKQYSRGGRQIREITLPGLGTASDFGGKREQDKLFFSFSNYRLPPTLYELDPGSGDYRLYRASNSQFTSDRYITEQVFYLSKDGTRIPMIITYAKGTILDGSHPTMLYGYGGFNISLTPRFRSHVAAWLELGGIYAVPNLRGGGEYGKAWHRAGTRQQKQNVFDDFMAAAQWLIDNNYTRSDRLAMHGGSNGGLLVGAVMTQRPDLFQVALPAVGVLDMLRYHTFSSGAGWAYDYGTAQESESMFKYLLNYSPLHNLNTGTNYPATLITTADHDDRVVPAHSFKFAAQLQHVQAGDAPVLIRIETDAGHGAGTPTSKKIDLYTDLYSFTLHNMGVQVLSLDSALEGSPGP